MKRSLVSPSILPALLSLVVASIVSFGAPTPVMAQDPNACDEPGDAPNVIVGDLHSERKWGHIAGITSFSIGTTSCNIGTCWLNWITGNNDNNHPTIGQNMFRLKDGRFEHLGQSWLKHGFFALSETVCSPDCLSTDGEHLGVNCSDPYSSQLNGQQNRLGPKFEVNALTGVHPHPVTMQSATGDAVFKRLQVYDEDLDPTRNVGARYFLEGQYVAADDAAAGNQNDNSSYRETRIDVNGPDDYGLTYIAPTERMKPGILAWKDADADVQVEIVDDPDGGRFYAAVKVTDNGDGTWHYEYAIQNTTSPRAGGWFSVPTSTAIITNVGYHDVDYHSGEPFDRTDWAVDASGNRVRWSTDTYAANTTANALRWGTLYNYRFDADLPPGPAVVMLGLYGPATNPGDPDAMSFVLQAPGSVCNNNGSCDPGEDCLTCPNECTTGGPDADNDTYGYCDDCNDNDVNSWATPGEALGLLLARGGNGEAQMSWMAPAAPGGRQPGYEALRSNVASNFLSGVTCLRSGDPTMPFLDDVDAPTAGATVFYLVRATNNCTLGAVGTLGRTSLAQERLGVDCP